MTDDDGIIRTIEVTVTRTDTYTLPDVRSDEAALDVAAWLTSGRELPPHWQVEHGRPWITSTYTLLRPNETTGDDNA